MLSLHMYTPPGLHSLQLALAHRVVTVWQIMATVRPHAGCWPRQGRGAHISSSQPPRRSLAAGGLSLSQECLMYVMQACTPSSCNLPAHLFCCWQPPGPSRYHPGSKTPAPWTSPSSPPGSPQAEPAEPAGTPPQGSSRRGKPPHRTAGAAAGARAGPAGR